MSHQGPGFWFDTRIHLAVVAALLIVIAVYNFYAAAVGAVLLYALYLYGRDRREAGEQAIRDYLDTAAQQVNAAVRGALAGLPLAIAVVDREGRVHWGNSGFSILTNIRPGGHLAEAFPGFDPAAVWGKSGTMTTALNGRTYLLTYRTLPPPGGTAPEAAMLALYAVDITAGENLRLRCEEALPVFAYIKIDNYDDVLKGLSESQRAAILSEVNARLTSWASDLEGFLKKYDDDTYFAIFNRRALKTLIEDRFEILDRVRAIRGGNRIPVTLSLGVAADQPSFAGLAQEAQAGLDLALGRGGDQAAVHAEGRFQFFGGKAKAIEKSTRVRARSVAQALRELIGNADSVLVMGHAGEDFDSLGAALGVAKMARHLGKPTAVVVSRIGPSALKLQEILPEDAEIRAEIHGEARSLFVPAAQAAERVTGKTLLFVVDTHRPELTAAPELLGLTDRIVVIDHHRRSETFIANPLLVYLEPSASSASELVTELLMYFDDKLDLTRLEASVLYAGIVVDTKNFAVQTGVRTFDAAAYLRRSGADPALVRHLFRVDIDTAKARGEIIASTEILPGGVAVAVCPEQMKRLKNIQIVAAQAADNLLYLEGVRVAFVFFPFDDGVGISARSDGDVNVQVILEQLGGGGHQTVAGAQVKGMPLDKVREKVIQMVTEQIGEGEPHESNPSARSERPR